MAKAYDSVSHRAMIKAMCDLGLPEKFVRYMFNTYINSFTKIEVHGQLSDEIKVNKGIRQGDPLSTPIFCIVVDKILEKLSPHIGFNICGTRINQLDYADDIIAIASTKKGLQKSIDVIEEEAKPCGLQLNPKKSVALSIVPAGKSKQFKVVTEPTFKVRSGQYLRQLKVNEEWRYLGINFSPTGVKKAGGRLTEELARISKAPLKPQQKLKILRCFLIPRHYHSLVLAGTTKKTLRAMDRQQREAVRGWLKFPKDVPVGYFHAPCKEGGLGLPSFELAIPLLMRKRLCSLESSSYSAAKAVFHHEWTQKRLGWAERALQIGTDHPVQKKEDMQDLWAKRLHSSVDGAELRETRKESASARWIDTGSCGIPGREYVQNHHVHINTLQSRVRTSRGRRANQEEVNCRAGCHVSETTAHIVQGCFRTHGGRIKRHNAIVRIVSNDLRHKGWEVKEEPRYRLSSGLRKPDLLAVKDGVAKLVDVQVVSGSGSLNEAHERKAQKYNNGELKAKIALEKGLREEDVESTSCTVSWRGVWSSASAESLLGMGLTKKALAGISTRALQGSHINFNRFNMMTTTTLGRRDREGIG
jgi:hypothetical protein